MEESRKYGLRRLAGFGRTGRSCRRHAWFAALMLVAGLPTMNQGWGQSCVPPPSGLVDWWQGEGNAMDAIGTLDGTIVNGVGFVPGEVGMAFSFNGTNQYITESIQRLTNIVDSYTIEFWAWPTAARADTTEENNGITGIANQRYAVVPSLDVNNSIAGAGVSVGTNGVSVFEHAPNYLPSPLVYDTPISGWTHVAVVYVNRQPSLYLNGVLVHTGVTSSRSSHPSTSLGENDYNYGYYSGLLDEVSIYNRPLSAVEIQAIYNAGSAGKCPAPPMITVQPGSQSLYAGNRASFSVGAGGGQPLSYQWSENMTNIPAALNSTATSATLELTNISLAQSGNVYSVLITNPEGSTNSTNAALTVNPPPPCDPAPAGLVGWWAGEGNANDSFGPNNGTLAGGVAFTNGEVGQAFSFNGINQYVTITNESGLDVGGQFTIECWINRGTSASAIQGIVASDFYGIEYAPGSQGFYAYMCTNTAGGATTTAQGNGALTFPAGEWHHLAGTYDGTNLQMYLDGQPWGNPVAASGLVSPMLSRTSTSLGSEQGRFCACGNRYFQGSLDEVSIYNRALGPAEIQAIFNAASTGKCPAPPLIISQPQSEMLFAGTTASFSVGANGSRPLSYQWQENMTNIPAALNPTATNAMLVLTNISVAQSGNVYSVLITNSQGLTNSTNAVLTVLAPGSCFPPPAGIISWWPGEKSGIDIIGTNNGTLVGGVTFAPGEVAEAFNLNGTSQYVDVPNSPSLNPTNAITCEAWINPAQFANSPPIIKRDSPVAGGYTLELNSSGGVLFSVYVNGAWVTTPLTAITLNQWTHVAGVYDGLNVSVYVNGVLTATASSGGGAILSATNDLQIGHDEFNPTRYFKGLIDEPTLYGVALTAAQIQDIYDAGSAGKCSEPEIAVQPASQVGLWGGSVVLSVSAAGTGPFTYQWDYNGAPIANATNATLTLGDLQFANAGAYTVTVGNQFGSQTSAPANLTVNPAGVSISLYAGIDITGTPGLTYGVQYSTDLNNTNDWLGLANVTLSQTNELYFDLTPAQQQHRYYRVVPGPISIP